MIGKKSQSLPELCEALVDALRRGDQRACGSAHEAVIGRARRADSVELTGGLAVLADTLRNVPLGVGGGLAVLAGGFIDLGARSDAALDALATRIADGLERAVLFPGLWEKAAGGADLPDPADEARIEQALAALDAFSAGADTPPDDARMLAEAWFTVGMWVPGLLVPLQRPDVRRALPHRVRLTEAAAAAREQIGSAHWLFGLLQVVDDESVIVLHRAGGRGFEVRIGGIGDNFQLHTLLAATLIGDPARGLIEGRPPEPAWVAAATDGEMEPVGGIRGQFNLVDAFGEWIWNEGRPADIPALEGRRVIVIDPPPYERGWNAGRVYPLMRPTVVLERVLPADEAAGWLSKVAPDARSSA